MTSVRERAAAAALATERLARALASKPADDPITVAYLRRLLHAAATVEARTETDRARIDANSRYLGPLAWDGPGTTASRNP
jgi:hypothetical protein